MKTRKICKPQSIPGILFSPFCLLTKGSLYDFSSSFLQGVYFIRRTIIRKSHSDTRWKKSTRIDRSCRDRDCRHKSKRFHLKIVSTHRKEFAICLGAESLPFSDLNLPKPRVTFKAFAIRWKFLIWKRDGISG